jgi:hypothetical protein
LSQLTKAPEYGKAAGAMRRFFGRKDKNQAPSRSLIDIYGAYRARPVVQPASLYPLLNEAYSFAHHFVVCLIVTQPAR